MQMDLNQGRLSPKKFEHIVKAYLESVSTELVNFKAIHRESVSGVGGLYEIDVTVRFKALGAEFLVLVECKHHKNPIKRDIVQILYDRICSIGAHKGMIFATTSFQSGAIKYAKAHGIALITITPLKIVFQTYGAVPFTNNSPWSCNSGDPGWVFCPNINRTDEFSTNLSSMDLLNLFLEFPNENNP